MRHRETLDTQQTRQTWKLPLPKSRFQSATILPLWNVYSWIIHYKPIAQMNDTPSKEYPMWDNDVNLDHVSPQFQFVELLLHRLGIMLELPSIVLGHNSRKAAPNRRSHELPSASFTFPDELENRPSFVEEVHCLKWSETVLSLMIDRHCCIIKYIFRSRMWNPK